MSCKPENTYGSRITISVVGWTSLVLFGFQSHVLVLECWFFWTRGNSPGSPFIIERRLHKKFVVKTLIVGPAILNIATGQNVFCVRDTLSSYKFKSEESGSQACKKQEMFCDIHNYSMTYSWWMWVDITVTHHETNEFLLTWFMLLLSSMPTY